MIEEIAHIGLTVKSLKETLDFYIDVLGLKYVGEILMEGKETDLLFNKDHASCKVAYVTSSKNIKCPPLEFIEFINKSESTNDVSLYKVGISEICFKVDDIEAFYQNLINHQVEVLSKPQYFDFTKYGFSKSKAIYFKDNNGIILEAMEYLD